MQQIKVKRSNDQPLGAVVDLSPALIIENLLQLLKVNGLLHVTLIVKCNSPLLWRKRWDSNPRALADYRISSAARYDHFDTLPSQNVKLRKIFYHYPACRSSVTVIEIL